MPAALLSPTGKRTTCVNGFASVTTVLHHTALNELLLGGRAATALLTSWLTQGYFGAFGRQVWSRPWAGTRTQVSSAAL